jgi:hypothetical protein
MDNQYFLLPAQPDPNDRRPRNAFGFLIGFGEAYAAYYRQRDARKIQVAHELDDAAASSCGCRT